MREEQDWSLVSLLSVCVALSLAATSCSHRVLPGAGAVDTSTGSATLIARAAPSNITPTSVAVDANSQAYIAGYVSGAAEFVLPLQKPARLSGTLGFVFSSASQGWVKGWSNYQAIETLSLAADGNAIVVGRDHKWNLRVGSIDDHGSTLWARSGGRAVVGGLAFVGDRSYTAVQGGEQTVRLIGFARSGSPRPDIAVSLSDELKGAIAFDAAAIASDDQGALYITGSMDRPSSPIDSDVFAVKTLVSGKVLWAMSSSGSGVDAATSVVSSSSGTSVVVGHYSGAARFGSISLPTTAGSEAFIAKASTDGRWLWVVSATGGLNSRPAAVARYRDGSIVVVGRFVGAMTIGNHQLKSAGKADAFAVKVDGNGQVVWARRAGGLGEDYADAVAVGPHGEACVVGTSDRDAQFDQAASDLRQAGLFMWILPSASGR